MRPRGHTVEAEATASTLYEAEAKAGCNEAKAEAVIFGLKAEAISRT